MMRAEGITLPMHLGTPGVTDMRKLMSIAARIGLSDSVRYLRKQRRQAVRLVLGGNYGPDGLLEGLAPAFVDPAADIRALHIFTFNQVAQTVGWQREALASLSG